MFVYKNHAEALEWGCKNCFVGTMAGQPVEELITLEGRAFRAQCPACGTWKSWKVEAVNNG